MIDRNKLQPIIHMFRDTWHHLKDAQLLQVAAALAYTTIFSIVPLLAVSFSVFKAFGGLEKLYGTIEPYILNYLAEGASDEAMAKIRDFIGRIHAGALGAGGLVTLVLACMNILLSAENAINRVWRTQVQRGLFQRVATYWMLITLGPVALSFAIGLATSGDIALNRILPSGAGTVGIGVLFFFLIYKFVPNRKVHWVPALVSAIVTAGLSYCARLGYGLYTANVLTYHKIYGSLGAIPILLLWIYIMWVVILAGAALSAAIQRRFDFK